MMLEITYWILMLSKVGEVAGLPMAVYETQEECLEQIEPHVEDFGADRETYWRCLGVLMREER